MPRIAHSSARSAIVVVGLALAILVPSAAPAAAGSPPAGTRPPGLAAFMEALAMVESGGRYTARNPISGAYGRYQIMPSNWPVWAGRYLGNRTARPTPRNQDRVAAGRLSDLYRAYGSWDRTAYWWLTGKRGPRSTWSAVARRYVDKIMRGYRVRIAGTRAEAAATPKSLTWRAIDDANAAIAWTGSWKTARHSGYAGGSVHYATRAGSVATLRFKGRSVRVVGPSGPTRGRVQVLVDGKVRRVVDLRASRFHPRTTIYTASWSSLGTHTVALRVLGTAGRPMVAVDGIVIGR